MKRLNFGLPNVEQLAPRAINSRECLFETVEQLRKQNPGLMTSDLLKMAKALDTSGYYKESSLTGAYYDERKRRGLGLVVPAATKTKRVPVAAKVATNKVATKPATPTTMTHPSFNKVNVTVLQMLKDDPMGAILIFRSEAIEGALDAAIKSLS